MIPLFRPTSFWAASHAALTIKARRPRSKATGQCGRRMDSVETPGARPFRTIRSHLSLVIRAILESTHRLHTALIIPKPCRPILVLRPSCSPIYQWFVILNSKLVSYGHRSGPPSASKAASYPDYTRTTVPVKITPAPHQADPTTCPPQPWRWRKPGSAAGRGSVNHCAVRRRI